jgi:hypothetical protein
MRAEQVEGCLPNTNHVRCTFPIRFGFTPVRASFVATNNGVNEYSYSPVVFDILIIS